MNATEASERNGVLVNIVHPGNPYSPDPDGIITVQRNFIRVAPECFRFVYWGVRRPGVNLRPEWARLQAARWRFEPVALSRTQRPAVPLSLRFASRLMATRNQVRSGVLRFDRVESAVPFLRSPLPKALFLHTWNVRDNRDPNAESRWRWAPGVYDAVFRRVLRSMDLVFVLRPDMADALKQVLPHGNRRVRPFEVPVDLSAFRPLQPEVREQVRVRLSRDLGLSPDTRWVLFAGRLEGQKRPFRVIDVAQALSGDRPEIHMLIAGSGSLEKDVARAAAAAAPGKVHMLGPLAQPSLAEVLGAADALFLPSAFEGLPNVLLESLAAGTPVVASRYAGRSAELLSDGRIGLMAEDDADDFARAIRTVLLWGGVQKRCRASAELFDAERINAPVYEDLQRLVGRQATFRLETSFRRRASSR